MANNDKCGACDGSGSVKVSKVSDGKSTDVATPCPSTSTKHK